MAKDVIVKGRDNLVVFVFDFDITGYIEIIVTIGNESYSTVDDATELYIEGTSELVLNIGETTALAEGRYYPEIVADDVLLSGECKPITQGSVRVC